MISKTVLVLAGLFEERLAAAHVSAAISRGLSADGRLECDACPLETDLGIRAVSASKPLDEVDFDRRMRAARALVIACAQLDDRTLAGSIAFEAATRARQAGVPAYAVTGHDALDPFEARIVDLQIVLEASTVGALSAAGRKLATLVQCPSHKKHLPSPR
ncbi:MAG TPA: glycerate kinase [Solirubrobacteraceae bacterium]|nr:glycerate kinase [Solirubrobacteraceae bacterium]